MAGSITRTYTFTDGTTAFGSQVESEVQNIVTTINNLDAGTLSWTVVKSASGNFTGNIAMNSNKITGLANGSASTDSATFGQLHLLQVPVFNSETVGLTTSSATFVDGGLSAVITPTSTTSTIYIFGAAIASNSITGGTTVMGCSGTTTGDLVTVALTPYSFQNDGTNARHSLLSGFFKDTPGTVSAQTYKLRFAANNGGSSKVGAANASGKATYIILFEVI